MLGCSSQRVCEEYVRHVQQYVVYPAIRLTALSGSGPAWSPYLLYQAASGFKLCLSLPDQLPQLNRFVPFSPYSTNFAQPIGTLGLNKDYTWLSHTALDRRWYLRQSQLTMRKNRAIVLQCRFLGPRRRCDQNHTFTARLSLVTLPGHFLV